MLKHQKQGNGECAPTTAAMLAGVAKEEITSYAVSRMNQHYNIMCLTYAELIRWLTMNTFGTLAFASLGNLCRKFTGWTDSRLTVRIPYIEEPPFIPLTELHKFIRNEPGYLVLDSGWSGHVVAVDEGFAFDGNKACPVPLIDYLADSPWNYGRFHWKP